MYVGNKNKSLYYFNCIKHHTFSRKNNKLVKLQNKLHVF